MGFLAYEFFGTLAALSLAFYYSWRLTLVIISAFPAAGVVLFFVSMPLGPAIEAQKRELTRASKYANTAITAINTVKAYNGQDQEVWQYYDTIRNVATSYLIQARCNALQFGITKFVMVGLFVQGFWYGLVLVKQGMDPGGILTTFYACLAAMQAMETILPQWLVLTKGMSAGQTLKSIMTQMKNGRVVTNMVGSLKPESCEGDIEVKGVKLSLVLILIFANKLAAFIRISIQSPTKCTQQYKFLLPSWRDNLCRRIKWVGKEHIRQSSHEILRTSPRRDTC